MKIKLAKTKEVSALVLRWEMEQQQRFANPTFEYAPSRQEELQRVADEYKQSEEKRQANIASKSAARSAARAAKKKADSERWERIWKEKFEDPDYYARGAVLRRKA